MARSKFTDTVTVPLSSLKVTMTLLYWAEMMAEPANRGGGRRPLRPCARRRVPGHQSLQAEVLIGLKPDGRG